MDIYFNKNPEYFAISGVLIGVANLVRTGDPQNHNLML